MKTLSEQVASLEVELAALDSYWYLDNDGEVLHSSFSNNSLDQGRQSIGNMFCPKAEAQKELEARKVIAELRACEGARPFVIGESNWSFSVNVCDKFIVNENFSCTAGGFGNAYFEDIFSREAAITRVGKERIIAAAKWLACGE